MYRLSLALILLWMPLAWAEVTVIYHKPTRTVASWVLPPQSVEVEITNLTHSALGGTPQDYDTVVVPDALWKSARQNGKLPVMSPQGDVQFREPPEVTAAKQRLQGLRTKLLGLGLTNEEINLLVR